MRIIAFIASLAFIFLFACNKESFTSAPAAMVKLSTDTLSFDTVLTTVGSITKMFTIVNTNNRKLRIGSIKLGGGSSSAYSINVNGAAGASFNNYELDANDSMYVFVKVTIDASNAANPFLLLDSVMIDYNGNTEKVMLKAYGQNAHVIKGGIISTNTTWNNDLPYLVENTFYVAENTTLTIENGTRIYINAKAGFMVAGSLVANGGVLPAERIIFRGDRLDEAYRDLPGAWPGLTFTASASNNVLRNTTLLNAYRAIVSEDGANLQDAKIMMEGCIIHNAYDIGLYAINTSVKAVNCLVSQCGNNADAGTGGNNILISGGGVYNFIHCTVSTFGNLYQSHKQPVCYISNRYLTNTAALKATFTNCILYGEGGAEDELFVEKSGNDIVAFENTIYKMKGADPVGVSFKDCIKNSNPYFDSISTNNKVYSFRLKENSPAIDAAKPLQLTTDLDGNARPVGIKADIGCYEKQ